MLQGHVSTVQPTPPCQLAKRRRQKRHAGRPTILGGRGRGGGGQHPQSVGPNGRSEVERFHELLGSQQHAIMASNHLCTTARVVQHQRRRSHAHPNHSIVDNSMTKAPSREWAEHQKSRCRVSPLLKKLLMFHGSRTNHPNNSETISSLSSSSARHDLSTNERHQRCHVPLTVP